VEVDHQLDNNLHISLWKRVGDLSCRYHFYILEILHSHLSHLVIYFPNFYNLSLRGHR
jgi:hypothetical protein